MIYGKLNKIKDIEEYQLKKFNLMWSKASSEINFYKFWKNKFHLPNEIESIHDLVDFPVLLKEDINNYRDLIFDIKGKYKTISTGGSTGVPTTFPVSSGELDEIYANVYICRGWWGIKPFEKVCLLWGHSHLFGSGIKGQLNEYLRQIKDNFINTKRLNAYDMRPDTIKKYYNEILRYRPNALIGYSSSLYKISRFILDNDLTAIKNLKLKAVIATAETLSEIEAICIQKAFGAPVVIEYGSAEMGVVSYSNPGKANVVLWDTFYCHSDRKNVLHTTSLNDRVFPLINYYTGDLVDKHNNRHGILSFNSIVGREKQDLTLKTVSGEKLVCSGILFVHILKNYPFIYSVQCKQITNTKVLISLVSNKKLDLISVKKFFYEEISKTHPKIDWESIEVRQVLDVIRTIAGKEKIIV